MFDQDLNLNLNGLPLTEEEFAFYKDLSLFFNTTQDLLCIADTNARFKRVNPAVIKLLGYSVKELFSHPINYFVHPDDQDKTNKTRTEMFGGKPLHNFENRYITKNGEVVWLSWTSVYAPERQLVFAVAKDITLRKNIEHEKNNLYHKLEAVNKELEYFARIASHDLRAPVSNILSLFDILDESKIDDEDSLNVMRLIKKSTERVYSTLEKYIDDLKNKEKLHRLKSDQNIKETTRSVIDSIENIINKSNAKIETDFLAFDTIPFDKGYLTSVILNLLTNAIKYASPNRAPEIKILTRFLGHKKQLMIIDNGLGMDMMLIKNKIFGLNQTFHQNKDGKGLGLFLVKSQLEEMGAEIDVESEVDKGTTFIITFNNG
ncbi:PAS domain S-box protein [Pedobacter sp. SD-b]|uniref:histidine kinase n=1 Tax=Pedobacter segetis TaxID=2793069 RepID=A0ABS1BIG4_9SPHI|nr:PAS domain-containing sensor histidine kinase [Pedobacter segetis]MBK0382551.1 PAS domain S-box protein [Pedobacter segetis]